MLIWHLGAAAVSRRLQDAAMPVDAFMAQITERHIARVPGTAVFLTRTREGVPPVMVWHVRQNRALHERVFVLTIITESGPWASDAQRLSFERLAAKFGRATAPYGFMRRPDLPAPLRNPHAPECGLAVSHAACQV